MFGDCLSIVVPVYNAERTINRCVGSLLAQSYQNIEVILVDDGSTDNSPELCDLLSHRDDRIQVIHTVNAGPSVARNIGIRNAKGQYLAFVDADDTVEPDYYNRMIESFDGKSICMVISNWREHNNGEIKYVDICLNGRIDAESLQNLIVEDDISGGGGYPWNRVLDLAYFHRNMEAVPMFSEEIRVYEDKLWVIDLLGFGGDVMLINNPGYNYIVSDVSLSNRKYEDRLNDFLKSWNYIEVACQKGLSKKAKKFRGKWTLIYFWKIYRKGNFDRYRQLWKESWKYVIPSVSLFKLRDCVRFIVLLLS